MDKAKNKQVHRARRQARIRAKITGTDVRPRLSVFRSNTGLFLQLIDDEANKTLASVNFKEVKVKKGGHKIEAGFEAGRILAEKAVALGIKRVAFDRGGYKYHGRVKAAADGAKEGGLEF
jgi:large subunit ribosomal protein L18